MRRYPNGRSPDTCLRGVARYFFGPLVVGFFLIAPLHASATTYYVSPSGNDTNSGASLTLAKKTIQAAINRAVAGDTVLVADGTYAPITINKAITVRSVNGAQATIIDGGGVTRCVDLYANAVLDGFTVTRGYASYYGGGIYAYGGTVENCTINDNSAYSYYSYTNAKYSKSYYSGYGGGVYTYNSTLRNCKINGNSSPSGGGLYAYGSSIENCMIGDNSAYNYYSYTNYYYGYSSSNNSGSGGGIYAHSSTLRNCTITGNMSGNGGGIYAYDSTLEKCTITDNLAYNYYSYTYYSNGYSYSDYSGSGGGVRAKKSTLRNCTINGNSSGYGGGMYASGSTIETCIISNNSAYSYYTYNGYSSSSYSGYGGGVYVSSYSTLRNCTINGNTSVYGGGIYTYDSTVENCTIRNNSAYYYYSYSYSYTDNGYSYSYSSSGYSGYGGGVYAGNSTLRNCTISGNTSTYGGGIYAYRGTIESCTISDNSASYSYSYSYTYTYNGYSYSYTDSYYSGSGGGVYAGNSTLRNCTIKGNAAGQDGGGMYVDSSLVKDCNISGNMAERDGGGMSLSWGGTVQDCTISGNVAGRDGGGVSNFRGKLQNCTISGNGALWGGGVEVWWSSGTVENCIITENWGTYGGGGVLAVQDSTVQNCTINSNITIATEHPAYVPTYYSCGGGVLTWNGKIQNCTINENYSADYGGGIYAFGAGCKVQNCTLSENTTFFDGGGIYLRESTARNCLIIGNTAFDYGGGIYTTNGTVENCTIVGNEAAWNGGIYFTSGTVRNCITYYNRNGDANGSISYSCVGTGMNITGVGNIFSEPQFISAGAGYGANLEPGNYRLQPASLCINAGINQAWMTTALDLDGFSRILNSVVDMGTYELSNDPGILQFNPSSYSVNEDAGTVTLIVTRTRGNFEPASVEFTAADGTAIAGSDYTSQSGSLSWADGDSSSKTITIAISDDILAENDETFTVMLINALGAGLGSPNAATVKIADNEPPAGKLQFGVSSVDIDESGGFVILTITRTEGSYGPVSVEYLTSAGTATAGLDYEDAQGTLSWADGETASKTISVPITDDILDENIEIFTVSLRNAQSANLGPASVATVTIIDNDELVDLEVSGFKFVPVNLWAGDHPAEIEFKLLNEGPEDLVTDNTQLEISFYLSVNQALGDADDIAIGTKIEVLSLPAGSQTTIRYPGRAHNTDVTIPEGLSGNYYVFVSIRLVSSAGLYDQDGASAMRNGPIYVRVHPRDGGKDGQPWRSVMNDYDGDGQTDLTSYDETSGEWVIQLSASSAATRFIFGGPGYETVFGDYDGDGLADPAVHQRNGPAWQIMLSGLGYETIGFDFGAKGKTRGVAADYNNDFMADPGLYEEKSGRWYVFLQDKRGNFEIASGVFGGPGYLPVVGNYDGDGKADPAVYAEATGEWLVMLSGQGYGVVSAIFGGPGQSPVVGDYDGDGKADPMLSTGSEWVGLMSGSGYALKRFSNLVGTPVAGDFDGDGTADPAVISTAGNPSTGSGQDWYFLSSLSAYIRQGPYALRP